MKQKIISVLMTIILLISTIMVLDVQAVEIKGKGKSLTGSFYHEEIEGTKEYSVAVVLPNDIEETEQKLRKESLIKIVEEKYQKGIVKTIKDETGKEVEDVVGTGSEIELVTGRKIKVILYGDINGDGFVDIVDALAVAYHDNEIESITKKEKLKAGDLVDEKDSKVTINDALRIAYYDNSLLGNEKTGKTIVDESLYPKDEEVSEPIIILNGDAEVKINVGEQYTDLGATATDKHDGKIKVLVDTSKVNTEIPGRYEVTYTATNSVNITSTAKRIVEVMDYTTKIELTGNLTNKKYNEDDTINLDGIVANITKKYAGEITVSDLSKLGNEYEVVITQDNEINNKAKYNEEDDEANENKSVKILVKYINPIDEEKDIDSNIIEDTITVIGKIRELIEVEDFEKKNKGEIYSQLEIIKLKTPKYQENISSSNTSYEIKKVENGDESSAELEVNYNEDGTASYVFYGIVAGKYQITISSEKAESKIVEITLEESKIVDDVRISKMYEGVLKEGGDKKDLEIEFLHTYKTKNKDQVKLVINGVTKNRVTVTNELLDIKLLKRGEDNNLVEIENDSNDEIVGIRINAHDNSVEGSEKDDTTNATIKFSITNNQDENNSEASIEVTIHQESMFTISVEEEDKEFTLFLEEDETKSERYTNYNNDLYTLIPVKSVDQYEDEPEYSVIKAENLSTEITDKGNAEKVYIEDNIGEDKNYIKVAGFKNKKARNNDVEYVDPSNAETEDTTIDYIGIALNNQDDLIDEDYKLEKNPEIKIYHGNAENPALTLRIGEIVRKTYTKLESKILDEDKEKYRYDSKTPVLTVETGELEKDISSETLEFSIENKEKQDISGAEIFANNGEDGKVNVILYAPEAGTYTITAKIKDSENITTSKDITIVNNKIVDKIEFVDSEGNVQKGDSSDRVFFGNVRIGKVVINTIKYYHKYTDKNNQDIFVEIDASEAPSYENIKISKEDVQLLNGNISLNQDTDWGSAHINRLLVNINNDIEADEISFTLTIENKIQDTLINKLEKIIYVKILKEELTISKIELKAMSKDEETEFSGTPKLYKSTDDTSSAQEKVIKLNLSSVNKELNYTVFKISATDNDGKAVILSNMIHSNVANKEANIENGTLKKGYTFIDNKNKETLVKTKYLSGNSRISVIPLKYDEEKKEYHSLENNNDSIVEYIGIALTDDNAEINSIEIYYSNNVTEKLSESSSAITTLTVTPVVSTRKG